MGIIQCKNGHFYNNDVFDHCPNCESNSSNFENNEASTVPASYPSSFIDFSSADTVPSSANSDSADFENSNLHNEKNSNMGDMTVAIYNVEEYKTSPVAGWLVCIAGQDKGKDYRILAGRNLIGRSESHSKKYQVNLSDLKISRSDAVASIAYDEKHNNFIFGATTSGNLLPYVDGQPCMNQASIGPFSKIEIGETTLIFVPFCGEHFRWNTEVENRDENK